MVPSSCDLQIPLLKLWACGCLEPHQVQFISAIFSYWHLTVNAFISAYQDLVSDTIKKAQSPWLEKKARKVCPWAGQEERTKGSWGLG